jgi:cytochrome bd-type quinol oxidase subunit 1
MTLDLARWQFALTSINHFFFVPVTIGLAFLTACCRPAGSAAKIPGTCA